MDHPEHGHDPQPAPRGAETTGEDTSGPVGMAVIASLINVAVIAFVTFVLGGLILSGVALSGSESDAATLVVFMCLPLVVPVIGVVAGITALIGRDHRPQGGGEGAARTALAMSIVGAIVPVPFSFFLLAGGQGLGLPLLFSVVPVILWWVVVRRLPDPEPTSSRGADPAVRGA